MGGDRRRQRTQSAAPPLGVHEHAHVGQDAFPFGVGAAGHRHPPAIVFVHDRVAVFEVGEPHFVDVVRRAEALQFDRLRVAVRDGQLLGGLQQRQVIGEEQCGGAQAVAAVVPGDGQQGHVLGHLLVGDSGGGVQCPLRAHQCGAAEQADELHGLGRVVRPDDPLAGFQRAAKAPSSSPRRRAQASWMMAAEPGSRVMPPAYRPARPTKRERTA